MFPFFFFFNDTATTEIYTLSLHDALPIYRARGGTARRGRHAVGAGRWRGGRRRGAAPGGDRKSTRLNSRHGYPSYFALFFEKKKITKKQIHCTLSGFSIRGA